MGNKIFRILVTLLVILFVLAFSFYRMGFYKIDLGESGDKVPRATDENTIDFRDAPDNIGENYWVKGEVDHVFLSENKNYFINFCEDYRECPFSAVIFKEDASPFKDIEALEGETILLYGEISLYEGRPQLIIEDPAQLNR